MKPLHLLFVLFLSLIMMGCDSDQWITLFDGETLDGWRASENVDSWEVRDGALVTAGPRSHLFYEGEVMDHDFKNFEFMADVMTEPGSNSGIYIHTEFQQEGWPSKGYECQVINSAPPAEPGAYVEHKMTGSIYAIRNIWKAPVADNEWFNYRIKVQGKTIRTFINNELVCEYTEPEEIYRTGGMEGRVLSSGTFAFQCHDPGSVVYYKNIKVRPLPDDLPSPGTPPEDPEFEKKLIDLAAGNFPLIDLHVHLKGGLSQGEALANARKYGFTYGLAVNCGLQMGFETDSALQEYLDQYEDTPLAWHGMQAEGREWVDLFSEETISRFDYVFTDAMTWTNDEGRRMRLWIPEETEVGDPQDFMDQLVERIEQILNTEPVDIYVNPTYLPGEIDERYDELWTDERMDRVIRALAENGVALEINNKLQLPRPAFIIKAKEAGVKFTFGTNNGGKNDLGRMEYAIAMIGECKLVPGDMWMP
ncbi:MAG: family 16 glycoside hydrolase [Bacteroidales bacterium]